MDSQRHSTAALVVLAGKLAKEKAETPKPIERSAADLWKRGR